MYLVLTQLKIDLGLLFAGKYCFIKLAISNIVPSASGNVHLIGIRKEYEYGSAIYLDTKYLPLSSSVVVHSLRLTKNFGLHPSHIGSNVLGTDKNCRPMIGRYELGYGLDLMELAHFEVDGFRCNIFRNMNESLKLTC